MEVKMNPVFKGEFKGTSLPPADVCGCLCDCGCDCDEHTDFIMSSGYGMVYGGLHGHCLFG